VLPPSAQWVCRALVPALLSGTQQQQHANAAHMPVPPAPTPQYPEPCFRPPLHRRKGNSDADLSYVIRRLQGADPPHHSLVHMPAFRSPSFIRNSSPPLSSSRGLVQGQVAAACSAVLRSKASKGVRRLWQGGRGYLLGKRPQHSERGAVASNGQPATDGEGEDGGGGSEAISGSIAAQHTASKGCVFGWALSQVSAARSLERGSSRGGGL
jgi:hypothetical protein